MGATVGIHETEARKNSGGLRAWLRPRSLCILSGPVCKGCMPPPPGRREILFFCSSLASHWSVRNGALVLMIVFAQAVRTLHQEKLLLQDSDYGGIAYRCAIGSFQEFCGSLRPAPVHHGKGGE